MNSIRGRLLVTLLAGLGLTLIAGSTVIYLLARSRLAAEFDATLHARAYAIAAQAREEDNGVEVILPPDLLSDLDAFQVTDPAGHIIQSSDPRKTLLPGVPALFTQPRYWNASFSSHPVRGIGFTFYPVQDDENPKPHLPLLSIVVLKDRAPLDGTLRALCAVLLGVGLASLAISALLVSLAVRAGLHPLRLVADQAAQVDADSLQSRISIASPPAELQPITQALNLLLSRLDHSFKRERRFSADVAHELRTPVAELRALAEVNLKWPSSDPEVATAFRSAFEIALKMQQIVTSLLALVRCDEKQLRLNSSEVSLSAAVTDAWAPLATEAATRRLTIHRQIDEHLTATTDPAILSVILSNLLSNALHYTPPGGAIWITVQRHDNATLEIAIANNAPDLAIHDLQHMRERFWRKETSRTTAEHSGLGLSIADEFARLLGASLNLALDPQSILRISFTLPATDLPPQDFAPSNPVPAAAKAS